MRTQPDRRPFPEANSHWRVGIVASSFYKEETGAMAEAARGALLAAGIEERFVQVHEAPGCFEIPLIGAALAREHRVDALIGLGIIVQGETHHARLLAEQTARGIMDVQLQFGIPFAFEVLYVESLALAKERACGTANKGLEAAHAALHSLAKLHAIRS